MEEKIAEMIKNHYWAESIADSSAKEIASHFREFIDWCIDEVYIDNREETTSIYLINGEGLTSIGFDTLDELYNYWLTNVKTS